MPRKYELIKEDRMYKIRPVGQAKYERVCEYYSQALLYIQRKGGTLARVINRPV